MILQVGLLTCLECIFAQEGETRWGKGGDDGERQDFFFYKCPFIACAQECAHTHALENESGDFSGSSLSPLCSTVSNQLSPFAALCPRGASGGDPGFATNSAGSRAAHRRSGKQTVPVHQWNGLESSCHARHTLLWRPEFCLRQHLPPETSQQLSLPWLSGCL